MLSKDFWNDRAIRHGHTGHSEPFLYTFDQEARKFAVERIVSHLFTENKDKALDFGCGSGDFVRILKETFSFVVGYDFAEKVVEIARRDSDPRVKFTSEIKDLRENSVYDLILSVTVLQDLEEGELSSAVKELSLVLASNGYIIAVEFFVTEEWKSLNKENRVTNAKWMEILERNGITVVSKHSFYNPIEAPSASWNEYNRNFFLRFVRLFRYTAFARKIFLRKAREIIQKHRDVLGVENNTYYIYVLQKAANAD